MAAPIILPGLAGHAQALQGILSDLSTLTMQQLVALFQQYGGTTDFPNTLRQVFPEIVRPHAQAAATITAQWYDELAPDLPFQATPVVDLQPERVQKSIDWALHAPGGVSAQPPASVPADQAPTSGLDAGAPQAPAPTQPGTATASHSPSAQETGAQTTPKESAPAAPPHAAPGKAQPQSTTPSTESTVTTLDRLSGSAQRMVYDAARDTITVNAADEGVRWARVAQPDACAFCRVLATRSGDQLYKSHGVVSDIKTRTQHLVVVGRNGGKRGSRPLGEKYHDHCRCTAVPVRGDQTYVPPAATAQWQQDYEDAFDAVAHGTSYKDNRVLKEVLAHIRANTDAN